VFRLYSEVSYPGPYPLRAPWLPTPSDRNVTNAPENIVRTKREKIVTHYRNALAQEILAPALHIPSSALTLDGFGHACNSVGLQSR